MVPSVKMQSCLQVSRSWLELCSQLRMPWFSFAHIHYGAVAVLPQKLTKNSKLRRWSMSSMSVFVRTIMSLYSNSVARQSCGVSRLSVIVNRIGKEQVLELSDGRWGKGLDQKLRFVLRLPTDSYQHVSQVEPWFMQSFTMFCRYPICVLVVQFQLSSSHFTLQFWSQGLYLVHRNGRLDTYVVGAEIRLTSLSTVPCIVHERSNLY